MVTESYMSEENQPPTTPIRKKSHQNVKFQRPPVPPETLAAIKSEWLTGAVNTLQLAEKYNVERNRIVAFSRFYWKKEADAMGIKPAEEPPLERKRYGTSTWDKVKLEFLAGAEVSALSIKYGIPHHYLEFCSHKRGWHRERRQMYEEGRKMIQGTIHSNVGELAIKYEGFMKAAIEQIDVMTDKLKAMSADGTCTPDRLKTMVDSLGSIITMGMKIYGMEKPQTQVNNQFIRLDVMDSSASATMSQLARTIDVKSA
jgi:hypothetical protein